MRLCRSNNAVTDLHPGFIIGAQYRHRGFDWHKASGRKGRIAACLHPIEPGYARQSLMVTIRPGEAGIEWRHSP